jgi:predicted GTPase
MKKVIVVGSAGAGKSTLINNYLGRDEASASERKFRDGTDKLKIIPVDANLSFVDTPGLDSVNFPTNMTEDIQNKCNGSQVLFLLMVNGSCDRVTSWLKKLKEVLENVIGPYKGAKFLFMWRNSNVVSESDRNDARAEFPHAIFLDTIESLRNHIADSTLYKVPVVHQVTPQINLNKGDPHLLPALKKLNAIMKAAPPKPPAPRNKILVCASSMATTRDFDQLGGTLKKKKHNQLFVDAINEVLDIKKNSPKDYQTMKLMGDAWLKFFALAYFKSKLHADDLGTRILPVTGNDDDCAMPRFFNTYIKKSHDHIFPSERELISSHGKADVVEALIDHIRSKAEYAPVFKYVFMQLVS